MWQHPNRVTRLHSRRARSTLGLIVAVLSPSLWKLDLSATGFAVASLDRRAATPKAAAQIQELTQQDEDAKKLWEFYCKIRGDGNSDPSSHTDEFLVPFLDNYEAEKPSEATIAQMIAMVQADPAVNNQWRRYCIDQGIGIADPRLLAKDFVLKFLEEQQNLPSGDIADPLTADKVKEMCNSDSEAEAMWQRYAEEVNGGESNPYSCGQAFVQRFLEVYAPGKLTQSELEEFQAYMGDPLLKFAWGQYCLQGGLGLLGAEELPRYFVTRFLVAAKAGEVQQGFTLGTEELAEELREAINADAEVKQRWLEYCRTNGDGTSEVELLGDDFVKSFLKTL